jgi:hypothetical protein
VRALVAGRHIVAVATAMLAVAAGPAYAGSAAVDNGRLTFTAAPGEANKVTLGGPDASGAFQITDTGAPLTAGPGCQAASNGVVCQGGVAAVVIAYLGDGNDELTFTTPLASDALGGPGDDILNGGPGDNILRGEAGNDTLAGAGGNDTLIGAEGNDSLTGNPGDDTLQSGNGDDKLDGGDGNDTLTAKDGNDTLVGAGGNDRLEGGKGADSLDAGKGNDVLISGVGEKKPASEKRIRCGAGSDSLTSGNADPFPSDCERIDGAFLRLPRTGVVPLRLLCVAACTGKVVVRDAGKHLNQTARVKVGAGKVGYIPISLSPGQAAQVQGGKSVRLTAAFELKSGAKRQKLRATFTLLRRLA